MKKLLFGAFALAMVAACTTDNAVTETTDTDFQTSASVDKRTCPSEEIRDEMLANDPSARARVADIENQTARFIQDRQLGRVLADGTVEIPVVVNVLYRTTSENISDAQIQSQIDVLNADYSGTNADASKIPSEFQSIAA